LAAALRGWHVVAVEGAGDLGQAGAGRVLLADAGDQVGWESGPTAGRLGPGRSRSRFLSLLGQKTLEFVDGD